MTDVEVEWWKVLSPEEGAAVIDSVMDDYGYTYGAQIKEGQRIIYDEVCDRDGVALGRVWITALSYGRWEFSAQELDAILSGDEERQERMGSLINRIRARLTTKAEGAAGRADQRRSR